MFGRKKLNRHLKEIESIYNFTFLMSEDILKESLRDINSSQTYSKGMQFFRMHNPVSKFCENLIKIQEFMHLKD